MQYKYIVKNSGKSFEHCLEAIFRGHLFRKHGRIEKTDPPVKIPRYDTQRTSGTFVIFQKNPFVDYFGVLFGRAVAIEAKSLSERLPVGQGGLRSEQLENLLHWHDSGALTVILWHRKGWIALIDPADLVGRKSIAWDEITRKTEMDDAKLLAALKEFWEPFTVTDRNA